MTVSDLQFSILSKAYETCQALARSNAETAWKVRSWGIGIWAALMAYGYQNQSREIVWLSFVALFCIFVVELAIRQIEYAFIARALEIEDSFGDLLIGSPNPRLPSYGASTNIQTPSVKGLLSLLSVKRWLVWFPYLLLASFTAAAGVLQFN